MSAPIYTYTYSGEPEKKGARVRQTFNDDENPFAFASAPENSSRIALDGQPGRTYNNDENPFAFSTDIDAGRTDGQFAVNVGGGAGSQKVVNSWRLHRWNTAFRVIAFFSCLAVVLLLIFSKQTSNVELKNGSRANATAKYKYSGAFVFFLWVNVVVCVYALLLSVLAFVMGRRGGGMTTPVRLLWPVLVLDVIACSFLLLAFAAALAVEVVSRRGTTLTGNGDFIVWEPLCHNFHMFCAIVETSLAVCLFAYLNILAGACIDSYHLYLSKI